jgi:NhaP-type Na+/H+ or K+/H+ antiporter
MRENVFLVISLAVFAFALVSKPVARSLLTLPMVFVGVGWGLRVLKPEVFSGTANADVMSTLAEITLVLVLFSDATQLQLKHLSRLRSMPTRLLLLSLPLTIALGVLASFVVLPELGLVGALILGIILAPTDAALGQAVVEDEAVPALIRRTLAVESGLNDGICLPLLMIAIATAGLPSDAGQTPVHWVRFALTQIGFGFIFGGLIGWLGGSAFHYQRGHDKMTKNFERIGQLAMAILAYAAAEKLGGNGFISTFTAGLVFGYRAPEARRLFHFAEAFGEMTTMLVFFFFGFAFLPGLLALSDSRIWLYALTSLTLVRLLPVAVGLAGLGLHLETLFFIGWFGPRGLASILFLLLVAPQLTLVLGAQTNLVIHVVTLTIGLSVLLHGVTALPFARRYGRWAETIAG